MNPSKPEGPSPKGEPGEPSSLAATVAAGSLSQAPSLAFATWQRLLPRLSLGYPSAEPAQSEGAEADSQDREAPRDLEIRGVLGEGGMGKVLLAWQRSLGRQVAVKVLKKENPTEEARRTLLREAQLGGSLEHPGIVPVHALGLSEQGEPILVLKRVDGTSFQELLRTTDHPLLKLLPSGTEDPLAAHLWVLSQVCNAVHFAHSRGVVHRDIKPDNIMVGAFGEVYLLDFGVAERLPKDGALFTDEEYLVGTPSYMAPEMLTASCGAIDERTDVYLLGATLHEVLTGVPRHKGQHPAEILESVYDSLPYEYGPTVPKELADLAQKATSRDKAKRPVSALAFRQALETYLSHRSIEQVLDAAFVRLAELRELVTTPVAQAEANDGPLDRLSIECRFAFRMALQKWPESERGRAGLTECITLLCEDALHKRRPAVARSLLRELPEAPLLAVDTKVLFERVRELEGQVEKEQQSADALAKVLRDLDERVGAKARLLVAALALIGDSAVRHYITGGFQVPSHERMLYAHLSMCALFALFVTLGWRFLSANAFSKRFSFLVMGILGLMLANRISGKTLQIPAGEVLRADLLLITSGLLVGGISLHPTILVLAAISLGGFVYGLFAHERIGAIFATVTLCILLAAMALQYLTSRRGRAPSRKAILAPFRG